MHELAGKRVVVMGLGRFGGGAGAARFCARQGADVLVTDTAPADRLAESLRSLEGDNVRYRLGGHEEADFTGADLIVVNPAVDPRGNRYLAAARGAGVRLTSEIALLLERVDRRRVIGVTGTAGKSTTTAMIGHIIRRTLGDGAAHVGGNLGGSLLDRLERIKPDHWIVLEISSFMLETLDGFSPGIAVVTNLVANHLDRHGSLAAYAEAKKRLLRHQDPGDDAVLGPGVADWADEARGRVQIARDPGPEVDLLVPGRHNRLNAALAIAACRCVGVGGESAAGALADFPGLDHRLRLVAERGGVHFYDDSKATTPEAAILAVDCFPRRTVHAILGGFDKGADLGELARHAALRCAGAYTIGHTGPRIAELARRALAAEASAPVTSPVGRVPAPAGAHTAGAPHGASPGPHVTDKRSEAYDDLVHKCGELGPAVAAAVERARPGDVVLLSPGCASWDRYENYEARGRAFSEFALHCAQKVG